jgi:hypothetical protein
VIIDATYLDDDRTDEKVGDMTSWYTARTMSWPAKAVLAAAVLAAALVAAVPVALFAGVVMMLLGHVVGGLALFGAWVLAAVAAVTIAALSGARHLRKLVSRAGPRIVQLRSGDYRYND